MNAGAQLLERIYKEIRAIRGEIADLNRKMEILLGQDEEITEEEARELDILAKETMERGLIGRN